MRTGKIKQWIKNILYRLVIVLIAIILAICLRVFLFSVYSIPTPSMYPAIEPGDKVVVNKQIPGPRIIRNFFSLHKGEKPDVKRPGGYRAVRRNDVLVFNFPYSDWNRLDMDLSVFYVKRCVAIPGDTFYIENGIYKVKNCSDTLGNYTAQSDFFKIPAEDVHPNIFHCFPNDTAYCWNVKSFGPLYVPKKGDTIQINAENILLYRNLIRYETGKEIPDNLQSHIFQQNYYFMAGDYVFDSRDSRYWGLLPEDHIAGKVAFVWNTKDKQAGKTRWNRFLKAVK